MAQFNPSVPDTRDPNYLSYSHPISQPDADKTAVYRGQVAESQGKAIGHLGEAQGYEFRAQAAENKGFEDLLKGIGTVGAEVVKAGDKFLKTKIDEEVYQRSDAMRDYHTSQLEAVANPQTNPPVQVIDSTGKAVMPSSPLNLLPPVSDLPDTVKNVGDRASIMVQARQNGKISETDYIKHINMMTKDLRERYPGYREYIDQKVGEATGYPVANSYLRSLISDINASMSSVKSERDKIAAIFTREEWIGRPDAARIHNGVVSGKIDPAYAVEWANQTKAQEASWALDEKRMNNEKLSMDERKRQATIKLDEVGPQVIDKIFTEGLLGVTTGTGQVLNTPEAVSNWLGQVSRGEVPKPTSEQLLQIGQSFKSQRDSVYAAMYRRATTTGYTGLLGAEEVTKRLNAQMTMFDNTVDSIFKGDFAMIHYQKNSISARVENATDKLTGNTELGRQNLIMAGTNKLGGPEAAGKVAQHFIGKGYPSNIQKFLTDEALTLHSQPDYRIKGLPNAPNASVTKAKEAGVTDPNVYQEFVKIGEKIGGKDISDGEKYNLAFGYFSKQNNGFIDQFKPDSRDPKTGREKKGQMDVFTRLTSPTITQELYKMGGQQWKDYKNWAETEFSTTLFGRQIQDLQGIHENNSLKLKWDPVNIQLKVEPTDTRDPRWGYGIDQIRGGAVPGKVAADDTVRRLNAGLRSIAEIYKTENNGDTKAANVYVLKLLTGMGWNPQQGKSPITVPELLGEAVKTGTMGISKYAEEDGTSNSSSNAQRGSLESFIANPARGVPARVQNAPAASRTRIRGNLSDEEVIPGSMTITDLPVK